MRIALDYDGTFTADPELWRGFVKTAKARGHEVIIVTMRHSVEAIDDSPCEVVYTGRKAKAAHLNGLGLAIDIWIDDRPGWIFKDSR